MILTAALADRIERALASASAARPAEIQRLPDNPLDVELRTFGDLRARRVGRELAYYPYFNGPFDPRANAEGSIAELVAWYPGRAPNCYVRVTPVFSSAGLLAALAAAGLRHSDFLSVLYGEPDPASPRLPAGVGIDASDRAAFVELWTATVPEAERALPQRLASAEFTSWRCFVARLDGQAAAHAGLSLDAASGTAVLAAAATLPRYRGRGCQTALLQARLAEAARQGYQLAVAEASPGSTSQRNMQRVGLRLAYTKAVWSF